MPNGFGRGGGFGRGFGGGMGFGFHGMSPPWPYVGRGRGGLPRCGYFFSGAGAPAPWSYQPPPFYTGAPDAGYVPYSPPMTREQEIEFLKGEAEALRDELKEVEARISQLSTEKE